VLQRECNLFCKVITCCNVNVTCFV